MLKFIIVLLLLLCPVNINAASVTPDWTLIGGTNDLPLDFSLRHQDTEFNVEYLAGKDLNYIVKLEDFNSDSGYFSGIDNVYYVSLKSGKEFELYSYNNAPVSSGYWNTGDLGNKDLSHMTLWSQNNPENSVPIPGGVLLFGSGILSLIGIRQINRKK